jgi:hypothetical protein
MDAAAIACLAKCDQPWQGHQTTEMVPKCTRRADETVRPLGDREVRKRPTVVGPIAL